MLWTLDMSQGVTVSLMEGWTRAEVPVGLRFNQRRPRLQGLYCTTGPGAFPCAGVRNPRVGEMGAGKRDDQPVGKGEG